MVGADRIRVGVVRHAQNAIGVCSLMEEDLARIEPRRLDDICQGFAGLRRKLDQGDAGMACSDLKQAFHPIRQ